MASQISHIVYAKQYLLKNPDYEIEEGDFICGCVFPDIRRISDNIRKIKTHFVFEGNCDLSGLASFDAGWKFHIYCDNKREELLQLLGFYEIRNSHSNEDASNKLVEDFILYPYLDIETWNNIYNYFIRLAYNNNFPENLKDDIKKWYLLMADYVRYAPTNVSMAKLIIDLKTHEDKCNDILNGFLALKKDNRVGNLLMRNFELLLDSF